MFPTLYHFLYYTFGIQVNGLMIVNTFGLFVAISIAAAFRVMQLEMKRKTAEGLLPTVLVKSVKGKPYPLQDYILNVGLAFVFGYKILFLMFSSGDNFHPQEHIFTAEGSLLFGLLSGGLMFFVRYRADRQQRLAQPETVEETTDASWHMGNITTIALISGFLGAKLFHILEDPAKLSLSTIAMEFFSSGGWTFFGGLICGGTGVLIYCYRHKLNVLHILDTGGPMMMIAYGIGRFGCHFAGDGDWGLANSNPKPFSWLPDWAWAYTYPHNVLGTGLYPPPEMVQIKGFSGDYSYQLMQPVWPTPLYEALMGLLLFVVLWKVIRPGQKGAGNMFAWYLVFAGLERFGIETIREHGSSLYHAGGLVFSQAQMISVVLFLTGAAWLAGLGNKLRPVLLKKRSEVVPPVQ